MKWIGFLTVLVGLLLLGVAVYPQDPFEDPTEVYIDGGGKAAGDVNMDGNKIHDASGVLSIGSDCTTSHSLVTGDACFGSGAAVEFDDNTYFDAAISIAHSANLVTDKRFTIGSNGESAIMWNNTWQTNNCLVIYSDAGNAAYSGNIIFTDKSNYAKNHDLPTVTNITLRVFSATNPDSANDEHIGMSHNVTDGQFDLGSGDYRFNSSNGKSSASYIRTKTESVTFAANPGDASKVTTGSVIPAGSIVTGVSTRVTTTATNCTSVDIGIAAKDTDAFADGTAITSGTTTTTSDGNSAADYSSASLGLLPSIAAQEITVTAVGGNCFDGVWAITVHYLGVSAATSN